MKFGLSRSSLVVLDGAKTCLARQVTSEPCASFVRSARCRGEQPAPRHALLLSGWKQQVTLHLLPLPHSPLGHGGPAAAIQVLQVPPAPQHGLHAWERRATVCLLFLQGGGCQNRSPLQCFPVSSVPSLSCSCADGVPGSPLGGPDLPKPLGQRYASRLALSGRSAPAHHSKWGRGGLTDSLGSAAPAKVPSVHSGRHRAGKPSQRPVSRAEAPPSCLDVQEVNRRARRGGTVVLPRPRPRSLP